MNGDYSAWIGRSETIIDTLDPVRSNALHKALGESEILKPGDPLPALYHWLHFWNVVPASGLGADGHPAKGGFLPPVPLPRRMWAGGRVTFAAPLYLGETVSKTTTIRKIAPKSGKSGDLIFVNLEHRIASTQGDAIIEEQDIVYREAAASPAELPSANIVAPNAMWKESVLPDAVMLFRYSALTMNSHRIHYDRAYAVQVEAYPALVVHGPLQATLLARLAASHSAVPVKRFAFRGLAAAFDGIPMYLCGETNDEGAALWSEQDGVINMTATAYTS